MPELRMYINSASRLYIAAEPRTKEDAPYDSGDEWLSTAVQLVPDSTVEELLPHIALIKEKKHPAQLKLNTLGRVLNNIDPEGFILQARLDLHERATTTLQEIDSNTSETLAVAAETIATAPVELTPEPRLTQEEFLRKVMNNG